MSLGLLDKTSANSAELELAHKPQSTLELFLSGITTLWERRQVIQLMVRRDLLGKYKGSIIGAFWTIIHPLGHLLLYTFVFSVILKVRFNASASTGSFALYLMAGLLPWQAFSESLSRATTAILEQPNLVKRVVFPLEILPLVGVLSGFATELIALCLLAVLAIWHAGTVHATILLLPLIMVPQLLLTMGLSWLLASLGVYIRDVRHFITLGLSAWMYATPIVYPASAFPKNLEFLVWINPMAGMVTDYRRVIIEGLQPDWAHYISYTLIAISCWLVGYFFFAKTKNTFADVM